MTKENNEKIITKRPINKILFIFLLILIIVLIIVYRLANWKVKAINEDVMTISEVAKTYLANLYERDYEELFKYIDYDGVVTYISLYNNWSYNIAEDWDEIFELSQTSGIVQDMKKEVEQIFKDQLELKNEDIKNIEFDIIEDFEAIEESENLFKVVIRVFYKNEEINYDDEIYLRMKDGKAYVVASSFVEEISKKCKNTLITNEYTIKKSVDHAISNVESRNEKITRLKLSNSIYDFRFCTKDSAKKDLTVYSDDVELKAGDKIYLADLYAEDDGIYYEVILADIDGILRVGEIIELNSEK